jgi:hypothetical protein
MTYYACQFKEQGGYRMSTLKIIPEINIHLLNPIQWRPTDIKENEFEFINSKWIKQCTPQQNWTIEQWMVKLNKFIKNCRSKMNKSNKISQLSRQIQVIKPIPMPKLQQNLETNTNTIRPLQPHKNQYYSEADDENDPRKLLTEQLRKETEEFTIKRLQELRLEFGVSDNIDINGTMEIYFDE